LNELRIVKKGAEVRSRREVVLRAAECNHPGT
jgi:hypothetical protein